MAGASERIRNELSVGEMRERMVRVARGILKDGHDSEDAAHDAVVQALSAAARFRQDAQVSTWLHRIVVNAALMKRRKSKRAEKHVNTAASDAGSPPWLGGPEVGPSAPALLESVEQRVRLRAAVAQLPDAYRAVLERHVFGEQSPEAVAEGLGLTPSAVRTRIGRARQQLAALLAA